MKGMHKVMKQAASVIATASSTTTRIYHTRQMHLPPGAACGILRLNHQPGFLGHTRLHSGAAAVVSVIVTDERCRADTHDGYFQPDL
jgi:hypothetical protein